ncbi:hypothetical protein EHI8A_061670 [Entamoeba histolytica HM-1:IMSS-B]|uniref:Transmembrane protein n=6 Tax=Entamoeba histolytica TaxID=5759 RepID=B1N4L1_ENTH1|nr:hypothetical protein EHI_113550 [Entamoeba histolytica HM-1:IMSS]EMD48192.1 Hypothetical protein EHI5A_090090 [Entamoeba histolytica KU27]EMH77002.1 hypothetical protein EHI8A_061670 [Entamoeba histolytica HM-1:IMSS-B]EMS11693.1 hypothetical protein KM1_113370 [Entamoeba histolytica HM-3:IMSS]ENY64869.1 hypothetical protein EHI7A_059160 [Entamoeba histolytica HM-1:IMSS-A]GAT98517.1 hypothetical protein CL6EHI_113550 [Entamoeba histolytica]|eukprot:XP_001914127.1 hypothetical protein EHI_113550 [Entamoeba histolytica HM-1:IMSS]
MENLLYRPPQSNYSEITDQDDKTVSDQNALQRSVKKTLFYIIIATVVFIPICVSFNIATRPHSYTCSASNNKLFTKYIGPMSVDNTSLILPMYGIITLKGTFVNKKRIPLSVNVFSIGDDGKRVDKGIKYDTSSIQVPENDCQSSGIYFTQFEICKTLRFTLAANKTNVKKRNAEEIIIDKVMIEIESPPSIDQDQCTLGIEYILIDNTKNSTEYHHYPDPTKSSCIGIENTYFYAITSNKSQSQYVMFSKNIKDSPNLYPTTIGCNIPHETFTYNLTSRCPGCFITFSSYFIDPFWETPVFANNHTTKMYFTELVDLIGFNSYSFIHPNSEYSHIIYPYIFLSPPK